MSGARAYYNEIDPGAAEWLRVLIAEGHIAAGDVDTRSIVDVRAGDLAGYTQCHFFAGIGGWSAALRIAGVPDSVPIWTGSCPCQPGSLAGLRRGFADDRHLWPIWFSLIRELRPAIVFGEQVAAWAEWIGLVRGDLETVEYAVGCMPIEAASAGAEHLRDRYWFVGNCMGNPNGARLAIGQVSEVERGHVQGKGTSVSASGDRGNDVANATGDRWQQGAEVFCAGQSELGGPDQVLRTDVVVANADGVGAAEPTEQLHSRKSEPGCGGDVGFSDSDGRTSREHAAAAPRYGHAPSATSGDDFEWVIGGDGKARRVKSGIRLLAHGVSGRVGLLRGFGNAIDLRPAAQFIRASLEAIEALTA